ncbi:hypothetical protein SAMN04490356_4784 [Streptomyces melanosporofaciens]|uniref:Uncharacterized protein n=1 Tax=Streptomyces melanosporofaciens TaxID=67327 RepID=A0A1H4TWL6_STRMJ|nr:hypothetical protein SAMN04490356_4784 [Streptomyces melanosporofaciens]
MRWSLGKPKSFGETQENLPTILIPGFFTHLGNDRDQFRSFTA